jgi:hypothetical protein
LQIDLITFGKAVTGHVAGTERPDRPLAGIELRREQKA